jgi:PII-like signaling protein
MAVSAADAPDQPHARAPLAGSISVECLKLTSYFGERDRSGDHLVADALLDLYGEHRIQASVLLRGAQGFGYKHHLRTDRLLTLSEDLPAVAIALDTRERIEQLLKPVGEIQSRGLLTLEHARMLPPLSLEQPTTSPSASFGFPAQAESQATKLTIYLDRHERIAGRPAFVAVCELLHSEGIDGASALLGVDGTRHGHRRRARFLTRNAHVPMMIIAVGSTERIAAVLPRLDQMLVNPLLTLERVRVCKRDGELVEPPHAPPTADAHGGGPHGGEPHGEEPHRQELWQKLTVVTSEASMHAGRAVHLDLVRRLRQAGAAGATSLRGIWGFHGAHAPHGDRLLTLRRHVPVFTIVLDTPDRIARLFPIVGELTHEHGLVTSELARPSMLNTVPAAPETWESA